jgi:hypothetical protein
MAMTETDGTAAQRARNLPPRDARGRFVARHRVTPRPVSVSPAKTRDAAGRARSLPSRDARGRFVAFPTTSAPSWYVFCADGYRIPGPADLMTSVDPRPAPQPERLLPPARVLHCRRPAMRWDEVAMWLLIATFVVVVGWQMLHLHLPNR